MIGLETFNSIKSKCYLLKNKIYLFTNGKTIVNNKKILWVDMDDTICDFMTPFKKHVSEQLIKLKKRHDEYIINIGLKYGDPMYDENKWRLMQSEENWEVYKKNLIKELRILNSLIDKIEKFFLTKCKFALNDEEKEYFIYPQSENGFLLNLEPIPGAKESIFKLRDFFDVKILTKPSSQNPHCYTEKRIWIEEHYGLEMCEHLYFSPDKSLMRGDILVDDMIWKFKGIQLQFGSIEYPNWDIVYKKLMTLK